MILGQMKGCRSDPGSSFEEDHRHSENWRRFLVEKLSELHYSV